MGRWALQLTPHVHIVAPAPVSCVPVGAEHAKAHELPPPTDRDVEELARRMHQRTLAPLRRRGLVVKEECNDPEAASLDDPVLASCYEHALRVPRRLDPLRLPDSAPGTTPTHRVSADLRSCLERVPPKRLRLSAAVG